MSAKDESAAWEREAKENAAGLRHLLANFPLPEGDAVREDAEAALREHTALNQAAEEGGSEELTFLLLERVKRQIYCPGKYQLIQ